MNHSVYEDVCKQLYQDLLKNESDNTKKILSLAPFRASEIERFQTAVAVAAFRTAQLSKVPPEIQQLLPPKFRTEMKDNNNSEKAPSSATNSDASAPSKSNESESNGDSQHEDQGAMDLD